MILIIDNYDSFTHNLFQYVSELTTEEVKVVRNDAIDLDEIRRTLPSRIILSPGPGRPEDAGVCLEVVRELAGSVPILGVCLGHQVVAQAFGGTIVQAGRIVHGKAEAISLDGKGVFRGLGPSATFTRYHSLAVEEASLPPELEISARAAEGEIMGLRHKEHLVEAVQFHPESIASELGKRLLKNFLSYQRDPFPFSATLSHVVNGGDLDRETAEAFMEELTEGSLSDPQVAAMLVALSTKGIQPAEIAGCATVLQRKRRVLHAGVEVVDTCGTGGDGLGTFNVSSLAALVAAAAGAVVAKHGNRAVSSKSGSADFYRALGINIDLTPAQAEWLIRQNGFAFLYAPTYHGAMRHAAPARKALGIKTIMNLVGPLVNPAGAAHQLIGVYDAELCLIVARAAHMLGIKNVMVVHGEDGLDEISVSAPTKVVRIGPDGTARESTILPEALAIGPHAIEEIRGGGPEDNAAEAWDVLEGGGRRAVVDVVVANAAAALMVSGKVADLAEGVTLCRATIKSGRALAQLERTIELSARAADLAPEPDTTEAV